MFGPMGPIVDVSAALVISLLIWIFWVARTVFGDLFEWLVSKIPWRYLFIPILFIILKAVTSWLDQVILRTAVKNSWAFNATRLGIILETRPINPARCGGDGALRPAGVATLWPLQTRFPLARAGQGRGVGRRPSPFSIVRSNLGFW